jgi:HD-like signal output (HDOD) protein
MFKKLFGLGAKKDEEKQTLLPEAIRKSILHSLGLKSVPIMPGAAQQAFMLATNPNAEAHDYIEVLEADEGLSARILKIANSVFYDRGGGSRTIADAVNVVGLAELKNLLNATALSNLFPVRHHLRASFWTHNIATALTARVLSRSVYPTGTDQAFLAGLMHDIWIITSACFVKGSATGLIRYRPRCRCIHSPTRTLVRCLPSGGTFLKTYTT